MSQAGRGAGLPSAAAWGRKPCSEVPWSSTSRKLKRGDILEIDGDPWQATEVQSQTPSARGASLLVKAKVKNLRTGQTLAKTWRGGETVTTAEVDYRPAQFLYRQGDDFVFMDLGSYEQTTLDASKVGDAAGYLLENLEVKAVLFQERVIALNLPITVDLTVEDTTPAIKGATAQAQLKPARVETGITVLVPPYIEPGERIRVDTRDGRFVEQSSAPLRTLARRVPRGSRADPSAPFQEGPEESRLSSEPSREPNGNGQIPSAPGAAGAPREDYMCLITASPNSLHFTSVAPSMRRAKS